MRIVLTGDSDGLGAELAAAWRAEGREVLGLSRRSGVDLADPAPRLDGPGPCQLVQCAATSWFGPLHQQPEESLERLMRVNLVAPLQLTHQLAPQLERVVFVSSVSSTLASPDFAAYAAFKAALDGFARNLASEWQGRPRVQLVHPGPTRTGLFAQAGISPDVLDWTVFPPAQVTARKLLQAIKRGRDGPLDWRHRLWHRHGPLLDRFMSSRFPPQRPCGPPSRVALVTGAASGIGRALCRELPRAGWEVLGVDRAEGDIRTLSPEGFPPLGAVFHCAGISAVGPFERIPFEPQREVLEVNLLAPMRLTLALKRQGRLARGAPLVFLCSLSCFVGYPGASVYAASKDGLAHFARSLRRAWPEHPVVSVYPGPTRTPHAARYSPPGSSDRDRMPPEQVARAIVAGLESGARELIPGWRNRLFAAIGRLWPELPRAVLRRTLYPRLQYLS